MMIPIIDQPRYGPNDAGSPFGYDRSEYPCNKPNTDSLDGVFYNLMKSFVKDYKVTRGASSIIYEYDVPGVSKNDLSVNIGKDGYITIETGKDAKRSYRYHHRIDDGCLINSSDIGASLEDGVLYVEFTLSKEYEKLPITIPIQ
jgi:HSP20 family molecular chaperone IbpA